MIKMFQSLYHKVTNRQKIRYASATLILCFLSISIFLPATANTSQEVRFGVLTFKDKQTTTTKWQPIITRLQQQLPHLSFQLSVYYLDELATAVDNKQVDFILTQPSQYVQLAYAQKVSAPLLSLINLEGDIATEQFGGVIFTQAQRDDINDLTQIKHKRVATASINSFGAYQMQALELMEKNIFLPQDVELIQTGQPQSKAIDLVLSGKADVGFVRTGVLEALAKEGKLNLNSIKLLGAQSSADFPLLSSTRLYPEWAVASLPDVQQDIIHQVTMALLTIPHNSDVTRAAGIAGFTIAGNYRKIDYLMQRLRLPPFDQLPVGLQDIIQHWEQELKIISIAVLSIFSFFVFILLRRNRELNIANKEIAYQTGQLNCLNMAIAQSPEMIMITDRNARISYVNPATTVITGYTPEDLIGKNPNVLQSGLTDATTYQALWQKLGSGSIWSGELMNKRKNGEIYYTSSVISPVKDDQNHVTHYLAIERDITQEKKDKTRIHQLLYTDTLTGLGNRSLLIETLDALFKNPKTSNQNSNLGCLMFLNIDHFKWINKMHGVTTGDQLLVSLANRLSDFVDESGIAVRMVNDEFAILLTMSEHWQDNEDWLFGWEQRLQKKIHESFKIGNDIIDIHCSIGATYIDHADTALHRIDSINQLFGQAAIALKLAQKRGGNRLETFQQDMATQDLERHIIEQELQYAIAHEQLRLYLQPQYNAELELIGAECLIRWQHPEKGLVPPGIFIGVAEQSDLIITMSDWVLEQACMMLSRIQTQLPDFTLSVNISPRHFLQPSFIDGLMTTVNAYHTNPKQLVLEITEGLFLENLDEVVIKMKQIKKLGFSFSIDDFGTGYSSLSYLKQLPIDELKIDRAFIIALGEQGLSQSLVETIYAVATRMQLRVVAEGVETIQQSDLLNTLPDIVQQGYLHGKPDLAEHWVARWQKNIQEKEDILAQQSTQNNSSEEDHPECKQTV